MCVCVCVCVWCGRGHNHTAEKVKAQTPELVRGAVGGTSFWMCKVRCLRWLFGNKIPISGRGQNHTAEKVKAQTPKVAMPRLTWFRV